MLRSPALAAFEEGAWHLPVSVACVRTWREAMSILNRRYTDSVLKCWVNVLSEGTTAAKLACPDWKVCCQGGVFDEYMATKVVAGKLGKVQKAHNSLHAILLGFNSAAKEMQICPRVQVHDLTSGAIKVAVHTLQIAKEARTVIDGVELLLRTKHTSNASKAAAAFLETHKGKHASIDATCWTMFEVMAAEGGSLKPIAGPPGAEMGASAKAQPQDMASADAPEVSMTHVMSDRKACAKKELDDGISAASSAGSPRRLKRRKTGLCG